MKHFKQPNVVSFGEVLFDCYADEYYLGGAPLNFAWNLSQFNFSVSIVSAVGKDKLGIKLRKFLKNTNLDQTFISERPEATGTVDVSLINGEADFLIKQNVAWDHIKLPNILNLRPKLIYFGTVAQRTKQNRMTLSRMFDLNPKHLFYDVNLRPGHNFQEIILEGLKRATILKLTNEEWKVIQEITNLKTPSELLDKYELHIIALTSGEEGAEIFASDGNFFRAQNINNMPVVDTSGAGDAFSAAVAAGALNGSDPELILKVASFAGAAVVRERGAQIKLPSKIVSAYKNMKQ